MICEIKLLYLFFKNKYIYIKYIYILKINIFLKSPIVEFFYKIKLN